MSFGMEREEIKLKMLVELKNFRGGTGRFNEFQIEAIASAIALVIIENNTKIQYSLGKAGVDFK